MKTKKLIFLAIMVAMGCGLFVLESLLPPIAAVPGLKLGLANIVTLLAIVWFGRKEAGLCLLCRIALCSLFAGQAVYFLYSIAGGVCCYLVLCLTPKIPLWARSGLAAIAHNVGQVTVAAFLTDTISVYWLLLYLVIGAIISGSMIGIAAEIITRRLDVFSKGV